LKIWLVRWAGWVFRKANTRMTVMAIIQPEKDCE
jgi:hypothetical protein